jgi:hypothetical protein
MQKPPKIANQTINETKVVDEWPNFYKGRSYIRDETNKTEEEEEEDDKPETPEDPNKETE